MSSTTKLLFCDLEITGHHIEYMYHLIKYRIERPECPNFVLVTHPQFLEQLEAFNLPCGWQGKGISVIHPSVEQMRKLEAHRSVISKADDEFRIFYNCAVENSPKYCYLMALNKYQFVLGRGYARSFPCPIRGILFSPFSVMNDERGFYENFKSCFRKFRKHLQLLWMISNKKINHIFVLNDLALAQRLNNRYRRKDLFVALPDPILIPPRHVGHSIADLSNKPKRRIRFLLFGSLSARKGIFLVLDALRLLPEPIAKRIKVVFAGQVIAEDYPRFRSAVSNIQRDRPSINIMFYDGFIPFGEIPAVFQAADCVLMPYTLVGASSGVIGHSALYEKPVIGPAKGLIGQLIRHYGLGKGIAPMNPSQIAAAIICFVKSGTSNVDKHGMQKFIKERQPSRFVATLLGHE